MSENSRKRFWGTGAIESISLQLQKELPGLRGFGARNLKNMRVFYEEWASYLNSAAVAAELPVVSNQPPRTNDLDIVDFNLLTLSIRQPMAAKIELEEFVSLGFSHHIEILLLLSGKSVAGRRMAEGHPKPDEGGFACSPGSATEGSATPGRPPERSTRCKCKSHSRGQHPR